MDPERSLKLVIAHLNRVDPKGEQKAVKDLRSAVELARVLEARARLRGALLTHGG